MKKLLMIVLITLFTYLSFARTCIIYSINGFYYGVIVSQDLDCDKVRNQPSDVKVEDCWNEVYQNRPILQTSTYDVNYDVKGYTFINKASGRSQIVMSKATIDSYLAEGHSVQVSTENDILTINIMDGNPVLGPANVICIAYQKPINQLISETSTAE